MSKKGFTLAELLGVIIIIALLSLIIVPRIIGTFNEISEQIDSASELLIVEAAKDYYAENQNYIAKMNYCVTVSSLQEEGFLSRDLKNSNGELIPITTLVKIYPNGTNYKINERCNITDEEVINAAKTYYNDGLVTIASGASECITLADLQENFYVSRNLYRNNEVFSSSTSIKITNNGTLTVTIDSSC